MAFQRVHQSHSQNIHSSQCSDSVATRPFAVQKSQAPQTQEEVENQEFDQDKFEATGLKLKQSHGTITPIEQERLGVLQAKMDNLWSRRFEQAKSRPNVLEILLRNSSVKSSSDSGTPIQAQAIGQPIGKITQPSSGEVAPAELETEQTDEQEQRERGEAVDYAINPPPPTEPNLPYQRNPIQTYTQRKPLVTEVTPTIQGQEESEEEFLQAKCEVCQEEELLQQQDITSPQEQAEQEKEPLSIQPKLVIGQVGDRYEQEADRVAAQVMAMPDTEAIAQPASIDFQIQNPKSKIHQRPQLQLKGNTLKVPSNFESQLAQHQGSGQPLSDATLAFMEPRFGSVDFSNVRVHETPDLADAIQAQAFTHGQDIYFNSGKYNPGSSGGKELLAHELTHVVQQQDQTRLQLKENENSDTDTYWEWWRSDKGQKYEDLRPKLKNKGHKIRRLVRTQSGKWQEINPGNQTLTSEVGWSVLPEGANHWDWYTVRNVVSEFEKLLKASSNKKVQNSESSDACDESVASINETVFPTQIEVAHAPNGVTKIKGHHTVEVHFPSDCNCSEFQYRQFIAGVASGSRGDRTQDLSNFFQYIPGGRLPVQFIEDGMTHCPGKNYGHRDQQPQETTTSECGENRYVDKTGATDQASGCIYRGEDFPSITVNGLYSGDVTELLVEFRGEIQRNGQTIKTKNWTTVDESVETP